MGDAAGSAVIYIGFDSREAGAFAVARHSIRRRMSRPIPICGLVLTNLRRQGLYRRPTEDRDGQLWDALSAAPMSTEHACARFLVPHLARQCGADWALFVDGDVMARTDLARLFALADPRYAAMVVKHDYNPPEGEKMRGQAQLPSPRKNWSSACLWNVRHPSNRALTVEMVNTLPGRDLHRFCWLDDIEIGALGEDWNWLPGHSGPGIDPGIVHYTEGTPDMPGYGDQPYADDWRAALMAWAAG